MDYIQLKRATLLGRLTALLDLETLNAPPRMALWPGILPVLDMTPLLREGLMAVSAAQDLRGAAGTFVPFFTCTVGERWTLRRFRHSGSATFIQSYIVFKRAGVEYTWAPQTGTSTGGSYDMGGMTMEPGDILGMLTNGDVNSGAIVGNLFYDREEVLE